MKEYITRFEGKYRFLSNFWNVSISNNSLFDDNIYKSVEVAYQASKTLDRQEKDEIRMAKTAGDAKRLGKK